MSKDRYKPKWVERDEGDEPEVAEVEVAEVKKVAMVVNLRCVWHTRLVIEPVRTLTGKRYVFEPGEVKSVPAVDAERLLLMEKKQPPGCCGGVPNPPALKYFVVA